jgi:hypothetical protein
MNFKHYLQQSSDDVLNTELNRLNEVIERHTKPIEEYDNFFKEFHKGKIENNPIVVESMLMTKVTARGTYYIKGISEEHFITVKEKLQSEDGIYVLTKEGARIAFTQKMELFVRDKRQIELTLRARKKGKEKMENVGYVYVLSNQSLPPNTYKIGSTYGLPEERAEELTGTGHLTPFKVVAKIKIQSAEYYEKSIHKLLNKYRVGKEYFELELDKIKDCLQQVSILSEEGQRKVALADLKKKIKIK